MNRAAVLLVPNACFNKMKMKPSWLTTKCSSTLGHSCIFYCIGQSRQQFLFSTGMERAPLKISLYFCTSSMPARTPVDDSVMQIFIFSDFKNDFRPIWNLLIFITCLRLQHLFDVWLFCNIDPWKILLYHTIKFPTYNFQFKTFALTTSPTIC